MLVIGLFLNGFSIGWVALSFCIVIDIINHPACMSKRLIIMWLVVSIYLIMSAAHQSSEGTSSNNMFRSLRFRSVCFFFCFFFFCTHTQCRVCGDANLLVRNLSKGTSRCTPIHVWSHVQCRPCLCAELEYRFWKIVRGMEDGVCYHGGDGACVCRSDGIFASYTKVRMTAISEERVLYRVDLFFKKWLLT